MDMTNFELPGYDLVDRLHDGHDFLVHRARSQADDESLIIRVHDNGVGIPRDNLDKIFNPFFTTKPTGTGPGLGLSISHEIVARGHGGSLTVRSEAGEFAEFVNRLPKPA